MSHLLSTETLTFCQGEAPLWTFDLIQENNQAFLLNGYTLVGNIGFPFSSNVYLKLTATQLYISAPSQVTLKLSSQDTYKLPIGEQSFEAKPNLALSVWGRDTSEDIPLIRTMMLNLPMVFNG
jgi:hypothetical protein